VTDQTLLPAQTEGSERPWGSYAILHEADDHKVKTITVQPGKRLSYQTHEKRAEHWYVVSGSGIATINGVDKPVFRNSTIDVGIGIAHRIANTGRVPLVFIEVQTGDYFGEDDIVRLADDFGRSGE
jgi:mannose-6-phosphate isomerase